MRCGAILFAAVAIAVAQNPLAKRDAWAGTLQGDGVTLEMSPRGADYAGTLTFQGKTFPAAMKAVGTVASGSFEFNGQSFEFTLTRDGDAFRMISAGAEYKLVRKGAAPAAISAPAEVPASPPSPATSAASSIVGSWRNATGWARFNADGTGVVDGTQGRYEIHGKQLTLIGEQGQATVGFDVNGDVLKLVVNGQTVTLNRVKEEAGGGSIRPELVGKWCWISVTTANQGARQSSRCFTLNGNGTYAYAGETDSYNPYGGATSQSADAGTWTATESTLTAHSRSGKTTTYRLEKRNHPKNVRDPMIVLDGQTFVTAYNKPPW